MKVNVQPLADYVLAQAEEAETKTASGLYLPDKVAEKPQIAKVLAVGKDVKHVKIGERVVHKSYGSTDLKLNNENYLLIKEEDLLATIK